MKRKADWDAELFAAAEEFQAPKRQREKHPCSAHPSLDRNALARS
jgi:hypothetical protein